jgi:dUTP pyrophosphatase
MNPQIKIKKLVKGMENIGYAKQGDAGIDLRASGRWIVDLDSDKKEIEQESYELEPMERILVKAGIEIEIPRGFWGNIRDRSGIAFNHGIHALAGVVDETYRGEIGVVIVNLGKKSCVIKKNDRIAQMVVTPCAAVDIIYNDELEKTGRGKDGFGSTGKR